MAPSDCLTRLNHCHSCHRDTTPQMGCLAVDMIPNTGEAIAACMMRPFQNMVCLVHCKLVPGRGVICNVRSNNQQCSDRLAQMCVAGLKRPLPQQDDGWQ